MSEVYEFDEDKSSAYLDQVISALRFLCVDVKKNCDINFDINRPKREIKLPSVLNTDEVIKIIESIDNLKHRAIIMLIYSAGLRVSEASSLKISDIDSKRMLIHIKGAKGKKDRYTLLSDVIILEFTSQKIGCFKDKRMNTILHQSYSKVF